MSKKKEYRIRWAWINISVGRDRMVKDKRCIAEYSVKLFGRSLFWWPVENGEWRTNDYEAQQDIEFDRQVHEEPLPETKYIDGDA